MPGHKPETAKHIVCSVPHSATRTLQSWLDENRPELIDEHYEGVGYWHFTHHPKYIEKFFAIGAGIAYIPVRNLFDVCDSWERRYGKAVDKTARDMSVGIQMMIDVVDRFPGNIEIFKMEELPVLRGIGPNPEGWDREAQVRGDRVKWIRDWVKRTPEVEAFYRQYYTADELWWL